MSEQTQFAIGGANGALVQQLSKMSNRHGLITGATGKGKTITLQVLAESFSSLGVTVFAADIKGDLSGLAEAGKPHVKIDERLAQIPLPSYSQNPYQWCSGIFLVNGGIPFVPLFLKWDHCYLAIYSI